MVNTLALGINNAILPQVTPGVGARAKIMLDKPIEMWYNVGTTERECVQDEREVGKGS